MPNKTTVVYTPVDMFEETVSASGTSLSAAFHPADCSGDPEGIRTLDCPGPFASKDSNASIDRTQGMRTTLRSPDVSGADTNPRDENALPIVLGGREDRDGCDCPPWVLACAHFGNRLAYLVSTSLCQSACEFCRWDGAYTVTIATGTRTPCWFCDTPSFNTYQTEPFYDGPDYEAALRAFRQAEAALLEASS